MKLCLDSLEKWLDQKQLIQKAIQGFWGYLNNCKKEDPDYRNTFEEDDDSLITLVESSIAFEIEPALETNHIFSGVRLEDCDCCIIRFEIEYKCRHVGSYKYYCTTEGICFDDRIAYG
jgi:hypothetical protein